MPISQLAFVRSTLIAMLVGVASLLAIVSATLWLVGETRSTSNIVTQASQRRAELIELRDLVLNAETGQRGYLLTEKLSYLEPYETARTKIPSQIEVIRSLLKGDEAQLQTFDRLSELVTNKISELSQTIRLARDEGKRDDALEIVNTDRGRNLMVDARAIFTDLVNRANNDISTSIDRQQSNMARLRLVTFAGAIVILAVSIGGAIIGMRYTAQLADAKQKIQDLNAGLEERVRERTADLGRANEEIQRFAYIVTHDLRAPLVNIMGFTSELEASLGSVQTYMSQKVDPETADADPAANEARQAAVEDLPEAISFIRSSTKKMDGLINAILKLSREGRRTLKPELIDLTVLLTTVCENVQHQLLDANGTVSIEGRVPPIVSDRLALDQIFGNLLDNAVKYRNPKRPLAIKLRIGNELGRQISISVEDNGRGIAKQDHERIFDLFRRSGAQDQPGEGIGLAHVRAMARNLGGDIVVTSELGQGTTFRISLPKDLRKVMGVA